MSAIQIIEWCGGATSGSLRIIGGEVMLIWVGLKN